MKKLLAALLILCMIPVISFAVPDLRELKEYLFLKYWDLFGLSPTPEISTSEYETFIFTDTFVVDIYYDSNGDPIHAVSLYYKDLDFDFVTYNMAMLLPFFEDEYEDAFLLAMTAFKDDKGYYETNDGKGYVKITREKNCISVYVAVR